MTTLEKLRNQKDDKIKRMYYLLFMYETLGKAEYYKRKKQNNW